MITKHSSNPVAKFAKQSFNVVSRLGKTTKVAGFAGLRVAQGEPMDAQLLKETFEQLGTTYIKIGQFIASTPSIFPRSYVEAFQTCLDQTTPVPFSHIQQVIESELAQPLSSLYASIDPQPLASASIAQVHAARLHTGEDVVVKVQKPDVETIMQTDLGVLQTVTKLLERIVPKMKLASIEPIIDEIRIRMLAETDFYQEAKNIEDFNQFLSQYGTKRAVAPIVYYDYSSKKVLTMQRLHGVAMTDTNKMRQYCQDPAEVLTTTLNIWFASLMMCQSFHADLHAGNLLLLTDGRIGFIDFGIVGQLDPESWQATLNLMQAFQHNDYDAMAHSMIKMGMTSEQALIDTDALATDLQTILTKMMATNTGMTTKDQAEELNQMMMEMVKAGERYGIHFPRDFALLLKQLLYFDRFMKVLAPDMDIFDDGRIRLVN